MPFEVTQRTVQQYRFSQKELDPDFVAFNSNNRRYHYPMRVYLPIRGTLGQLDPMLRTVEIDVVLSRNPYLYSSSRPTLIVDPWGLQDTQEQKSTCPYCFMQVWCHVTDISQLASDIQFVLVGMATGDPIRAKEESEKVEWQHCYIKLTRCDGKEVCISGNMTRSSRTEQVLAALWPLHNPTRPNYGKSVNDPEGSGSCQRH